MSDQVPSENQEHHVAVQVAPRLLGWYDRHARRLPWRARPGAHADPYHVWLSEIMLQQTTVATVGPYFERFLNRWPQVTDLAAAPLDDVLTLWAGLGYYARARNLHKCANAVVTDHAGQFPRTEAGLRALPGIGPYTAAAISAIAFDLPAPVMDGNIERVTSRLFAMSDPLPGVKPALMVRVAAMTPQMRPGDFAQAMMDLGATVCTPGRPKCAVCPLVDLCRGRDIADTLPRKQPKKKKPTRVAAVFWIEAPDGTVFLRRRAEQGLLGGMMEFPSTPWMDMATGADMPSDATGLADAGLAREAGTDITRLGDIRHTFTHFHLIMAVHRVRVPARRDWQGVWQDPARLSDLALPTLMRKVAKHAMEIA